MALAELPPELILHIAASFLTREIAVDRWDRLPEYNSQQLEFVPDFPSINSLSQTNVNLHSTLDRTLYSLCVSVEPLGKLALLFAVENQLESTVEKLVAAGISLDHKFYWSPSWSPYSLLQIAAGLGLRSMVVKLLGMHAHADETNKTALDCATRKEHIEVATLLAPVRLHYSSVQSPSISQPHRRDLSLALMESAAAGNTEVSEYLISQGADVNFVDEHFYADERFYGPPLYYAASTKKLGLVQLLLASGADPNLRTTGGRVPLFNTANIDIIQALLNAGANIQVENDAAQNVLVDIVENVELLRFFLERRVDPNHADNYRKTPLHYACRIFKAEIAQASVQLLLQFGASVEKTSDYGATPVDLAMRDDRSFPEVVEVLEPYVQNPDLKLKIATWLEQNRENIG
ncbi:ankyrin repeat-containing domain protein [Mycena galopus ATCC 62051]|nr:ankyrin repeat-containing domain protein [Mycena galopus ATCC 62051]